MEPLDNSHYPAPRPPAYKKVAIFNFGLVLFYILIGSVNSDFGFMGAGLLAFAQGCLGFLVGMIILINGNREYGLPILLFSLLTIVIGFGVCAGGFSTADMNFH